MFIYKVSGVKLFGTLWVSLYVKVNTWGPGRIFFVSFAHIPLVILAIYRQILDINNFIASLLYLRI